MNKLDIGQVKLTRGNNKRHSNKTRQDEDETRRDKMTIVTVECRERRELYTMQEGREKVRVKENCRIDCTERNRE